jgi:hypothetical protein
MTNNNSITHPLFSVILIIVVIASGFFNAGVGNQIVHVGNELDLYANIETIGVVVSGLILPKTAQLMYRQSDEITWRTGHPLVRIDDGRLVGSLFGLSPETSYDVRVLVGNVEVSSSITTQSDELEFTPSAVLHVNDDAPAGGNGSAAAPFRTIQEAVNRAGPGTQVLVADGIYREAVTFPTSGDTDNWIQVKAEGSGTILDGSVERTGGIWAPHLSKRHVWSTANSSLGYLARDGKRFYTYDNLSGLLKSRGHGDVTMNEGWYFDPNSSKLYVRSLDDPSLHKWQLPRLVTAFNVKGRDWIWIEGFEMQFYGRCGVCTVNASHVVIRRNKIHNMQLGVFAEWSKGEDRGNDTRIEDNEIYDPRVNEFPWQATKATSMEGTAIIVRGHIGAIVRGNNIHNYFNGIYTGSSGALQNSGVAFDADIYDNYIHDISDDALEPEGSCVNHRFRNNIIDASFVGVSLAPVTQGPTWVLRNVISNYTSRSLKWALNSDGFVYVYHNTSWTTAGNLNAMDLITPVRNSLMRNNIFQSTGYAFAEVPTGSSGNDWNNNNWYTTRGTSLAHFKWDNKGYNTIAQLCAATRLECNGHEDVPGFTNPQGRNFTLLPSSPNIDRGVLIPGINDTFIASAPDVGAHESAFDAVPRVLSSVRTVTPSTGAANLSFTVTFSEPVNGVNLVSPFSDFKLVTNQSMSGASITGVTFVSETIYMVRVAGGSGSGAIRLEVVDDDSIVDLKEQPLGGMGTGNGNFTAGEEHTIKAVAVRSTGGYDGWILEHGENTDTGGAFDRGATTFNVGDDQKNRQSKGILSFDTSSLPDTALIVSAQLKVKKQSLIGSDPFKTHGPLLVEIRNGPFSNNAVLQAGDFSAAASPGSVQDQLSSLTSSWYAAQLSSANLLLVNKAGATQFRLFFDKDDNGDMSVDAVRFFSGNSTNENKPELIIMYSVP